MGRYAQARLRGSVEAGKGTFGPPQPSQITMQLLASGADTAIQMAGVGPPFVTHISAIAWRCGPVGTPHQFSGFVSPLLFPAAMATVPGGSGDGPVVWSAAWCDTHGNLLSPYCADQTLGS